MKRGTLVTAVLAGDFGKPRPSLIIQSEWLAELPTVVLCPLTSDQAGMGPTRVKLEPNESNGLKQRSLVMVEKVTAVNRGKIGDTIGSISASQLREVDAILTALLGYSEAD